VTWRVLARRDLREYRAGGTLWKLAAVFALVGALAALTGTAASGLLSAALGLVAVFAAPLVAVSFAHDAVPGRVANGRARLTLSLPHSRRAFVAAAAAVAGSLAVLALTAAFSVGLAVAIAVGVAVDAATVAALYAVGVALATAFVGGTLAATVTLRSTTLAATAAYGAFLVSYAWPAVLGVAFAVLNAAGVTLPDGTLDLAVAASPFYAALAVFSGVPVGGLGGGPTTGTWLGVVSLTAWAAGGIALAVRRFDRVDL
jgi:ABC-type transport system involved in multi-copper enzyme maturation permease subunit